MTQSFRSTGIAALCALMGVACSSSDPSVSESTAGNPGFGGSAGTSGSGGSTPGAPQLPACPPDALVETTHANIPAGTYSVPASAELAPYASYPIGSINFCWSGDLLTLGYKLPELLLGKAEHVAFVGPWNPSTARFELSGQDGTGICERAGTTWTCTEEFVGIGVDLTELSKELEGLPAEQVSGRMEVSKLFGQDPIGVLTFVEP